MKQPKLQAVIINDLLKVTSQLSTTGTIQQSARSLVYLNVDNDYIHKIFPLLVHPEVQKPDYFQPGSMGAHITVFYPEEAIVLEEGDLGKVHHFEITELVRAHLGLKTYYILLLSSPSLVALRQKYGLSQQLAFRGYGVEFHITVGKSLSQS